MGGEIPSEIFKLQKLEDLLLQESSFSGTLSEDFALLNATLEDLWLNENDFSGAIPVAFNELTKLEQLLVQGNDLVGSISDEICMRRGFLSGEINTLEVDCDIACLCCDPCDD
jgi:hypothetical protein